jgi:UDP-glucose:(heptosyl)LPS alpha-1,3-glucosyltransferase
VVAPIERAFYRSQAPRHAIAISQVVARELRDHYGWERPLTIIPHGVDTVRFRPVRDGREKAELRCRYGLGATDWVWIFVGEASKGARQAIRQLAHFPTAKLLVVSRSHREPYLQLAKELDVHDRLVWRGADPEPECAFRTADLFLYPSDYDAFGMVVTEAMASALPVVVGRDIGAAELLRHEQNGLLVDPSQAEQLCSAIALIQGEPARSKAMGEAGRHTALACSWKTCAERTAAVYDQLLTPGEKRGRNEISVP